VKPQKGTTGLHGELITGFVITIYVPTYVYIYIFERWRYRQTAAMQAQADSKDKLEQAKWYRIHGCHFYMQEHH